MNKYYYVWFFTWAHITIWSFLVGIGFFENPGIIEKYTNLSQLDMHVLSTKVSLHTRSLPNCSLSTEYSFRHDSILGERSYSVEGDTIFTNLSARAGYDTRSVFKRSLTGLNSEFSFS